MVLLKKHVISDKIILIILISFLNLIVPSYCSIVTYRISLIKKLPEFLFVKFV